MQPGLSHEKKLKHSRDERLVASRHRNTEFTSAGSEGAQRAQSIEDSGSTKVSSNSIIFLHGWGVRLIQTGLVCRLMHAMSANGFGSERNHDLLHYNGTE